MMKDLAEILQRKAPEARRDRLRPARTLHRLRQNGLMTSIDRAPRNIANRIIEEFMLAGTNPPALI